MDMGLPVRRLQSDQHLQDAVLKVHHAFMITIASNRFAEMVQNHMDVEVVVTAVGRCRLAKMLPASNVCTDLDPRRDRVVGGQGRDRSVVSAQRISQMTSGRSRE